MWPAGCLPHANQLRPPCSAGLADLPTPPLGRIPDKPYDWQKKPVGKPPRCGKKEVEIRGACYRRAHPDDYSPPCEAPTVQWENTCYYAIHKAVRHEASMSEQANPTEAGR